MEPLLIWQRRKFLKRQVERRVWMLYWQGMRWGWRSHQQMPGMGHGEKESSEDEMQRAGGRYGRRLAGTWCALVMWALLWDPGDLRISLAFRELPYCLWQVTSPPHISNIQPISLKHCLPNHHQWWRVKRWVRKDKLCWYWKMRTESPSLRQRRDESVLFRGKRRDDVSSLQLDLKQKIWHRYVLSSKCKEKAATDEVQNVQHAASTAKSLPGRDKCRTAELHKAQLSWSLAAKERQGVQPPLLCDGAEHGEPNGLCRSVLGATHARAALWVFFVLIIKIR